MYTCIYRECVNKLTRRQCQHECRMGTMEGDLTSALVGVNNKVAEWVCSSICERSRMGTNRASEM